MIEIIINEYLDGALPGVPVFLEMPTVRDEELPTEFVLVERIAGSKTNQIDFASFAFKSYSTQRLYNAALLDESVRRAMEQAVTLDNIASVRLASNYNFTDVATKRYRYQAVYDIYYYGG
jgi:hypothetical protein